MWSALFLVLDDPTRLDQVLDVWEAAGVQGATILESSGLARRRGYLRDDAPLFPSVASLVQAREENHVTLFAVVDESVSVEGLLARTESVTGNLDHPGTGLFFAVPLSLVKGARRTEERRGSKNVT